MKKQWIRHAAAALTILGAGALGFGVAAWADGKPAKHVKHARLIKVSARRFVFNPSTIKLKKGETVDFELKTEDVLMGFSVPDFNTRSDIPPGQVMHLTLTPDKTGTFTFLCDIFCGSGHENMSGTIVVE
ncbi:MAG: cupredoxin domain-containing protein [Nevskia sp.]|nr:cupredoxin domain-containing protein [Nevskia sp.]